MKQRTENKGKKSTKNGDDVVVSVHPKGYHYCRVLLSYEIDEQGKRTNYKYKYIYGEDKYDVLIQRAKFIDDQIKAQTDALHTKELLTTYLREWLYVHKRNSMTDNAFDRLESTYLHQITPALQQCGFVGMKLNDVKTAHIQQIMNRNFELGYSYSTLVKTRDFLQEFFTYYEDVIAKNPMNKYKLFSKDVVIAKQTSLQPRQAEIRKRIKQRKAEIKKFGASKIYIPEDDMIIASLKLTSQTSEKDIHCFTDKEIERLKVAIKQGYTIKFKSRSGNPVETENYIPKQGAFFLFMLNSGIRGGEAVALQYSDFDFEKKTVRIHSTAVNTKQRNKDGSATGSRNRTFTTPKTSKSDAVLPLSDEAIAIIRDMLAQEPKGYDGYVVHSNGKPLAEKSLWQRFSKILKGAEIEPCGLHSLRHTFGTKFYEKTQDVKMVSEMLRHENPSFTAKVYIHNSDARTRDAIQGFSI